MPSYDTSPDGKVIYPDAFSDGGSSGTRLDTPTNAASAQVIHLPVPAQRSDVDGGRSPDFDATIAKASKVEFAARAASLVCDLAEHTGHSPQTLMDELLERRARRVVRLAGGVLTGPPSSDPQD